jgi:3-oxoacyl-[acyl-carrier-protein] synthase III
VIVGIGTSDLPRAPHLDSVGHHVLAIRRALDDCGLRLSDIDGYCCAGASRQDVAPDDMEVMVEYLGLAPTYTDSTMTGGSSFELHVEHAAAAIQAGLCETVLVSYGSDQLSRMGRTLGTAAHWQPNAPVEGSAQFEASYGGTIVSA